MKTRLATVAPDLYQGLQLASEEQLRGLALQVSEFATKSCGVYDARVDRAQEALRNRRLNTSAERAEVEQLVKELDELAWKIQEDVESGRASEQRYAEVFARARAAAAVAFALDPDPSVAAAEAIYEASFALDDLSAIRKVVTTALEG